MLSRRLAYKLTEKKLTVWNGITAQCNCDRCISIWYWSILLLINHAIRR